MGVGSLKKLLLAFATALLIPGMLGAATLGVYFDAPSKMAESPAPFSFFDVYLFLQNAEYYVTAVEYQLTTPLDPTHALFSVMGVTYPDNKAVSLGDPFSGHAIAYWPPMNGFVPGYNLVATLQCMTLAPCGSLVDFPLVIGPHPDSGELRGTFAPENELFPIIGLTSIICPDLVGTQEESWGAIKSLYR
jgi:hypothetical protein